MPAVSKAQQRFFGMVSAGMIKKPKGMKRSDVKKFAGTEHEGLPNRVNESKLTFKEFFQACENKE